MPRRMVDAHSGRGIAACGGNLPGSGTRILDCCAAPGGKTAILAENNPQAEITACDISQSRLDAMRRNFLRDPRTMRIHCLLADATAVGRFAMTST